MYSFIPTCTCKCICKLSIFFLTQLNDIAVISCALAVLILICLFFLFIYSTEHTEVKDLFIEAARLMKNGEIDADVQVWIICF